MPDAEPSAIRRLLLEAKVPMRDRRAPLVGLKAYEASGGAALRDLFSQAGEG